jgi:hypothetical protein
MAVHILQVGKHMLRGAPPRGRPLRGGVAAVINSEGIDRERQQQTHTDSRSMFHSTFLSTLRHYDDCPPDRMQVNLYGPENDGYDRGGMEPFSGEHI